MLEPMPPNLGTAGSDFEELAIPKRWNQCFPILEPRVPVFSELGSQTF